MPDMYFMDANGRVTHQYEINRAAVHYVTVQPFLRKIRRFYLNGKITYDEIKRIREIALGGDLEKAAIELHAIMGGERDD